MEQHAEILIGRSWDQRIPVWRDALALTPVVGLLLLLGSGARQMAVPFAIEKQPAIRFRLFFCLLTLCAPRFEMQRLFKDHLMNDAKDVAD